MAQNFETVSTALLPMPEGSDNGPAAVLAEKRSSRVRRP